MKKQLTQTTVYEPNKRVKVKVVNTPVVDELTGQQLGYKSTVTLTYKTAQDAELRFSTDDDMADFMNNIDYADPQQSLLQ